MEDPHWKTGFEIELLAPRGASRRDLAQALADRAGGTVRRIFYPQSEPSEVPGLPVFENLTLGFDALAVDGALVARCTDDLTIVADLDQAAQAVPGWYRIVSDDVRLLRLIMAQSDPAAPQQEVLEPIADLFGTRLGTGDDMVRLTDAMGASVAIAASLPSERERPCELITPPLVSNHTEVLSGLLRTADELRFSVPAEAAVHIHFDGERLRDAGVIARLVRVLHREGPALRTLVGTNPRCLRLGPFPDELLATVSAAGFCDLDWDTARARLAELGLVKYCDFNLMNLVHELPGKPTFEVRILPGSTDAIEIMRWARLFTAILEWVIVTGPDIPPSSDFYAGLALSPADRAGLGLG